MARYTGPVCRLCRREDMKLFLKGDRCYTDKCGFERRAYPPGQHGQAPPQAVGLRRAAAREAEGQAHLRPAERQFRGYYYKALAHARASPARTCSQLLERRLDNVVYRMGFADATAEARQLVRHGHFTVNGKRVNIPSYLVRAGDVVEVREKTPQDRRASTRRSAPSTAAACRSGSSSTRRSSTGAIKAAAGARGPHDADPRAAHRRVLLEVSRSAARHRLCRSGPRSRAHSIGRDESAPTKETNRWQPNPGRCFMAKNWRDLIRPRRSRSRRRRSPRPTASSRCEPLERGFGTTLGNALRRVLLSSLQGAAITAVKIEGALHEFTTIPGRRRGRHRHHPQPQGSRSSR